MLSLTIVTPTLNSAKTIRCTLESVRPLRECGAEHIVVDSQSTDGTQEMCHASGARVIDVPRGNMYSAINEGFKHSMNEWYTYLNGDDILYSDAVCNALDGCGGDIDILYGSSDYMDLQGRFLCSWLSSPPRELLGVFSKGTMPFPQLGTFFRNRVFKKLNGFNTNYLYTADFDFFLRALLAKFVFSRFGYPPIASFRLHPNQFSRTKTREMQQECGQSLVKNAVTVDLLRKNLHFAKFRLRNWHNYFIRSLRCKAIFNVFQTRSSHFG